MKKFFLFISLALIVAVVFAFNKSDGETEKMFKFPEYSSSLNLEDSPSFDCSADCSGYSCSGSGTCVCSCDLYSCTCEATDGPAGPDDGITVSINEEQYQKTKRLAETLFSAEDEEANRAYIHLVSLVQELKNKNHEAFHEQRDLFRVALYSIKLESVKSELNSFFEQNGFNERV